MTGTTPPPLHGPSSKEKKYDRQLRLWAASGQQALEDAHILLINSGPGVVGVETLKNLVLPGIGQFTILDSAEVTEADLGVNFFLENEHLGGSRAQHTCNLLKELNPDVQGHYINQSVESFIEQPSTLNPYTLIIVTAPVSNSVLEKISLHASKAAVATFYVHSIGYYGHFSIHLPPAFPIVDTHPPAESTTDLRLLAPWPELSQLAAQKTNNLEAMSDHEHGHVPYVLLLLNYLEEWKQTHGGKAPQNYKEKTEFREMVRKGTRTNNPEGGEENFDEAVGAVLKSLNPAQASSAVREVFESEECKNLTKESASFWLIAHAMSIFYKKHSQLPLPGSLPDMKAQSADYITLQNVYKSKARADLTEVASIVHDLQMQIQYPSPIPEKEIEAFCKNAGHIKLVRGRPFQLNPFQWDKETASNLAGWMGLQNPESLFLLYVALQAWDGLRLPGAQDANLEIDIANMKKLARQILGAFLKEVGDKDETGEPRDVDYNALEEYCQELTRAGGAELHNISALVGGIVSQEVIKVITKQYIPVDNTCLFDGVRSRSSVLRI
ncbi:uncharacterized protein K452DRAFT_224574 [Aplosporella prunicola CBS 121167]|uniref:NEDD8-activating enzyme E1 regulatory subunit n=1 Tax=Aplosporella prunicola CBS 121167 TaxID=1176127 RepID=A0A6A6BLD3_9PEZI|nr:uncharacterized protein K452DRAFT_224574 [Aplosporella prunicola CBS 121167]KAF2143667.1 hypothetical protein K452DRAFT_224574 [Aplosporella prunicola CBS 121167]